MRIFPWVLMLGCCCAPLVGAGEAPARRLLVACSADAPPEVAELARRVAAAAGQHPTLALLAHGRPVEHDRSSEALLAAGVSALAYANVVVVGLSDDPLIAAGWQHETAINDGMIEAFGFGCFTGDLGWVESGFNPWLHSPAVARPPYETHLTVITGTTPEGVALAVEAFPVSRRVNGLVGAAGVERIRTTLRDREPGPVVMPPPPGVPDRHGGWTLAGVTDCGVDVARNLLEVVGVEPDAVRLYKYRRPGVGDGAGAERAIENFLKGFHRLAYGKALLVADFADADIAREAVGKIRGHAQFRHSQEAGNNPKRRDRTFVPLSIWSDGPRLFMRSVPWKPTPAETAGQ